MPFIELCATSNFTFLTGASHPEEYVLRAAELGQAAIAVADLNSVAGIVRAHTKARELARDGGPQVRLIPAARLVLKDGFTLTALPQDRAAWGRLCRLLTEGARRAPKGECHLTGQDLLTGGEGLTLLLHPELGTQPAESPKTAPPKTTAQRGAGDWLTFAQRLTRRFPAPATLPCRPPMTGRTAPASPASRPWRAACRSPPWPRPGR